MASQELEQVYALISRMRNEFGYRDDVLELEKYRRYLGDWDLVDLSGLETKDVKIGNVDARWSYVPDADEDVRIIYLHGGGYIAGNWDSHGSLASSLARSSRYPVLFLEYRLAPEHPFPAALVDTLDAYKFVLQNGPNHQRRPRAVFLVGDSAGGGLTVAASLKLREMGERCPDALVAMGAFFDLDPETSVLIGQSGLVSAMASSYAGEHPRIDPLISPINADLRQLPPLLLQLGSADYLIDDSLRLYEKAKAQKANVKLDLWQDMPHVWQKFTRSLPEARSAIDQIAGFLKAHVPHPEI
jgi:acetyl esterase/lipase